MPLIILSITALVLTVGINFFASIGAIKIAALFCGLEGTALLASSISPPRGDMEEMPRGIFSKLYWIFTEGSRLNYPFSYNPVLLYGGLMLLAFSFALSAL